MVFEGEEDGSRERGDTGEFEEVWVAGLEDCGGADEGTGGVHDGFLKEEFERDQLVVEEDGERVEREGKDERDRRVRMSTSGGR